jgi:UDP:flavonoid glycosyltransferase YjiC (YdhE family)
VVQPDEFSPEAVRRAVREVLTDSAYRDNAARLRDEMAALPGLEHGVALLERLTAEKTPLVAASDSHSPRFTSETG